jgi:hypothetical protein
MKKWILFLAVTWVLVPGCCCPSIGRFKPHHRGEPTPADPEVRPVESDDKEK